MRSGLLSLDEVVKITKVRPYILRFWEAEFSEISPQVLNGEKVYSQSDIDSILTIKKLLLEEKLTIEHAKMEMRETPREIFKEAEKEVKQQDYSGLKEKLEELVHLSQEIKEEHFWN